MQVAPTTSPNSAQPSPSLTQPTCDKAQPGRLVRFAACLVYALKGRDDRQIQADVSYVSSELGVADELDVFEALDELAFAVETLEQAADFTAQRPYRR